MNHEKRYVSPPYEVQFREVTGEGTSFDFEKIIELNARCLAQIVSGMIEEGRQMDNNSLSRIREKEIINPLKEFIIAGEVARADLRKILGLGNGIDLQE